MSDSFDPMAADQTIGGAPNTDNLIKDVTMANFQADVLEASMTAPVIVDFWAPWCGPCKQLGPQLEQQVKAANGAVTMAKINIDEEQQIAGQMGVQSVPTVVAFVGGRPVDGFVGAQPESQIKAFIEKIAGAPVGPSPVEQMMEQAATALETGDLNAAANAFAAVMQQDETNMDAVAGLAQCYAFADQMDEATALLDKLTDAQKAHPAVAQVLASIAQMEAAENAGPVDELTAQVEADPKNPEPRFELAIAQAAQGDYEDAMDNLLHIVEFNAAWNDGAGKTKLLEIFDLLGAMDERTVAGRQKLGSLLFR